jgi:hypothetical protein
MYLLSRLPQPSAIADVRGGAAVASVGLLVGVRFGVFQSCHLATSRPIEALAAVDEPACRLCSEWIRRTANGLTDLDEVTVWVTHVAARLLGRLVV